MAYRKLLAMESHNPSYVIIIAKTLIKRCLGIRGKLLANRDKTAHTFCAIYCSARYTYFSNILEY